MSNDFTIGRLADEAAVNVETIRFYQRRGLMPTPDKPTIGHRRYSDESLRRLRFIKRAQMLGFTLEEIGDLLALDQGSCCLETRDLAGRKLELIEGKLAALRAIQTALRELIRECDSGTGDGGCPIIHTLAAD